MRKWRFSGIFHARHRRAIYALVPLVFALKQMAAEKSCAAAKALAGRTPPGSAAEGGASGRQTGCFSGTIGCEEPIFANAAPYTKVWFLHMKYLKQILI